MCKSCSQLIDYEAAQILLDPDDYLTRTMDKTSDRLNRCSELPARLRSAEDRPHVCFSSSVKTKSVRTPQVRREPAAVQVFQCDRPGRSARFKPVGRFMVHQERASAEKTVSLVVTDLIVVHMQRLSL